MPGITWAIEMETQELYRGRLIDHLQLVVNDLAASKRFYSAVFHGAANRSAKAIRITFRDGREAV